MRIFPHFNAKGHVNSFLVAKNKNAVLIDAPEVDGELIDLIEGHSYELKAVLCTHGHKKHVEGLCTLKKIYDVPIYAYKTELEGIKTTSLADFERFSIGGLDFQAIWVPGHSYDSLVYKTDGALFTGDVLTSGCLGSTKSMLEAELLARSVKEKIMCLDDNLLLFPSHGAPSKLYIEKMFNREYLERQMTLS